LRFDDTLDTVLSAEPTTPAAAQAAWRQLVDLIGRGRVADDGRALAMLSRIRSSVPVAVRASSARALFGACPPVALVRLLALDDIAVGAPVLRSADLPADDWIAILPALSPTARAVLRHRRDLPPPVVRALASFGAVDFVIGGDVAPSAPAVVAETMPAAPVDGPAEPDPVLVDTGPFVSVGAIALGLPVVAEALRRENDNEAPPHEDGTFRIADVVARLEAFQRKRELVNAPPAPAVMERPEGFRFETDPAGMIRWVEGVPRGALVGLGLARQARPAEAGVDGVASGAFRRRARFSDAHLSIAGGGAMSGLWLISAVPAFDSASGRFTGYRGSGRRPHRHERPEAATAAAPSSDSLRQLVHELRTPTNAIAGFSEMIEHQMLGPVSDPYRDQAMAMRSDAGGLLAAIDDLDAAARIDARALQLRPEPVALTPLLRRVADDLAPLLTQRDARLALPDDAGTTMADVRAVERLVARTLGAMIGAAGAGETIAVRRFDGGDARIGLSVTRPAALDRHVGDAVLAIDDEDSPASLLGIGFALRLARNLAREVGGTLAIGQRSVTLYLPGTVDGVLGRARTL
jgi:hypothetical protein